jgi:hypothetical protein
VIGWLDCSAGVSGDMLLGVLVDAGVPLAALQAQVDRLDLGVLLTAEATTRSALGATKVHVTVDGADAEQAPSPHRSWADVRALLDRLDDPVRSTAHEVFRRLAEAEASVHRVDPEDLHFHEVGAVDALADVVGVVTGFAHLGLEQLHAGPVGLGSGTARTQHGTLPVPVPAVLRLLEGAPVTAGPAAFESATPTGAALLATLVTTWGELPPLTVTRTATGAGGKDPEGHPNVTRLVLGETHGAPTDGLVLACNVDDLDPRLWPHVLQALLDAGAQDAWLTPILMKKGRPAHTLSVLTTHALAPVVRRVVFEQTTTLGLRETPVRKHALDRTFGEVTVDGQLIRVKHGWYDGRLVTSQPEWDDVAAAARTLGRPAADVLRAAQTSVGQTSEKKPSAPTPPASGTPTTS